jgi:hypothetical protein
MGLFDRLFGRHQQPKAQPPRRSTSAPRGEPRGQLSDEQALERYRYMLRTAPPETIEEAHAEAFAQLTPEQRRRLLEQLSSTLPERERSAMRNAQDDPQTLARMATRTEVRQPGTLERVWGGMGPGYGMGMGGLFAGSFLSSMAGMVVGSMIADAFFGQPDVHNDFYGEQGGDAEGGYDQGEQGSAGFDDQGDTYQADQDMGSDFGDSGADFGDFGGGDFGAL